MLKKTILPIALALVFICPRSEASLFGQWGVHGVVVNKTFRANSPGDDGIYKLELRDADNEVRRQMVTRELYLAYEIGDQFEPAGAPPTLAERAQRRATTARLAKVEHKAIRAPSARADVHRERSRGPALVQQGTKHSELVAYHEPKRRLIVTAFPQEMLPETEGF